MRTRRKRILPYSEPCWVRTRCQSICAVCCIWILHLTWGFCRWTFNYMAKEEEQRNSIANQSNCMGTQWQSQSEMANMKIVRVVVKIGILGAITNWDTHNGNHDFLLWKRAFMRMLIYLKMEANAHRLQKHYSMENSDIRFVREKRTFRLAPGVRCAMAVECKMILVSKKATHSGGFLFLPLDEPRTSDNAADALTEYRAKEWMFAIKIFYNFALLWTEPWPLLITSRCVSTGLS